MSLDNIMDLDTSAEQYVPPRLIGRVARLPLPLSVRSLESGEVDAQSKGEAGLKASPLTRISARHRRLAELIASGMGTNDAARAVGLTASRVSILKADREFQELVSHAQKLGDLAWVATNERLASVAGNAIDEINERFEEDPGQFSPDELLKFAALGADRTGFGPKTVVEKNVNVNFGDELSAARKRAESARLVSRPPVEEATVLEEAV